MVECCDTACLIIELLKHRQLICSSTGTSLPIHIKPPIMDRTQDGLTMPIEGSDVACAGCGYAQTIAYFNNCENFSMCRRHAKGEYSESKAGLIISILIIKLTLTSVQ